MALMRLLLSRCSRPWRLQCVCLCSCAVDIQHTMITILRKGGGRGWWFGVSVSGDAPKYMQVLGFDSHSGGHVRLDWKSPWSV